MIRKIVKRLAFKLKAFFKGIFWYSADLFKYRRLFIKAGSKQNFYFFPQIFDKTTESHTFDKHYVYMDRWAVKHLLKKKPTEHVDVGSSIRFLSVASLVSNLKFVDIRPISLDFENFSCLEGSILSMPFADNSVESLSCLHVAEHIGLGRYGDPLDLEGTKKACLELLRVLKPGGSLYFALPVGRTSTYFNAHRVHDPRLILEYFSGLNLLEFSAVNDQGRFMQNARIQDFSNARYSCGMFLFTKP